MYALCFLSPHVTLTPLCHQPDLPVRLQKNIPTSKGRRDKYYTPDRDGYTTYPFADGSVEPTRYKTEITIN